MRSSLADVPAPFLNYLSTPTRMSLPFWHAVRFATIGGLVAIAVDGVVRPTDTLTLFWGVLIPFCRWYS